MITKHAFQNEADRIAMQQLLRQFPSQYDIYPRPEDLVETLIPDSDNTLLWCDEQGGIAGFAVVSQYLNLHYHFKPGAITSQIEDEMITWAVARARTIAEPTPSATLDAHISEDDNDKAELLKRRGFLPTEQIVYTMARTIAEPLPQAVLPEGWSIRPLAGESEVDDYVAAHRAAYGTQKMTRAIRLAILAGDQYQPELDLVITAPSGEIAAFCVAAIDKSQNTRTGRQEGEIQIVGTRPEFRGRGLGRTAMVAGLHALRQLGMERATLTVGSWNTAALNLYRALGFVPESRIRSYQKALI